MVVASNVIAVAVNVLEHFVLRDSGVLLYVDHILSEASKPRAISKGYTQLTKYDS